MSISVHPELETRIRTRAEAEGLTVEAYLERLVQAEQQGLDKIEGAALEGLDSGRPIQIGASYWEEKHRRLDEARKKLDSQ